MFGLIQGKPLHLGQAHRSGVRGRSIDLYALPGTYEGDCRDHRAGRGQENPTASGEGRAIATGAGSKLLVIANLSPCLFRGTSMSPTGSSTIPKAMFLVLNPRHISQERQLSWDLLCMAGDELQSCLGRLDGHHIRRLACPPRIIKSTIISSRQRDAGAILGQPEEPGGTDRFPGYPAYLGTEPDGSSPYPLRRARRGTFSRR